MNLIICRVAGTLRAQRLNWRNVNNKMNHSLVGFYSRVVCLTLLLLLIKEGGGGVNKFVHFITEKQIQKCKRTTSVKKKYRVSFGNGVYKAFLVNFFAEINKTSRFNYFLDYALRRFRWRINKETFLSCSNIFPILAKLKVIQKQGTRLKNLCNQLDQKKNLF